MTTDDAAPERLRAAFETLVEDAAPGPDCADTARIWAAARGELPHAEARALLDHALGCPSCGMAWRLARQVSEESDSAGEGANRHATARAVREGWGWPHWAAVAAAVIAAVLIPVGVFEWRAPQAPAYREEGRASIEPLVPDGGALPRDGFVLRWSAGPPGTRYSVRLVRTDLSIVIQANALEGEEFVVPADALSDFPAGAVLYWRVEAHLPDGRQLVSDMFSVRLE